MMTKLMVFLKKDLVSLGMTSGILITFMLFMAEIIKMTMFISLMSMFSLFLIIRYIKVRNREDIMECFFVYVNDMWVCCSKEERPKENTNTKNMGFNGDWYYNTIYSFIGCTGDITQYDFKIIASSSDTLKISIIPDDIMNVLNNSDKSKTFDANYRYRHSDNTLKLYFDEVI